MNEKRVGKAAMAQAVRRIVRADIKAETDWQYARKKRVLDAIAELGGAVTEVDWDEVYDEVAGMYWRAGKEESPVTYPEWRSARPKEGER